MEIRHSKKEKENGQIIHTYKQTFLLAPNYFVLLSQMCALFFGNIVGEYSFPSISSFKYLWWGKSGVGLRSCFDLAFVLGSFHDKWPHCHIICLYILSSIRFTNEGNPMNSLLP